MAVAALIFFESEAEWRDLRSLFLLSRFFHDCPGRERDNHSRDDDRYQGHTQANESGEGSNHRRSDQEAQIADAGSSCDGASDASWTSPGSRTKDEGSHTSRGCCRTVSHLSRL